MTLHLRLLLLLWLGHQRQPLWRYYIFILVVLATTLYHVFLQDFEVLRVVTVYSYYLPVAPTISSHRHRRQLKYLRSSLSLQGLIWTVVLQVKTFVNLLVFFLDVVYVLLHNIRLYVINLIFCKTYRGLCSVVFM